MKVPSSLHGFAPRPPVAASKPSHVCPEVFMDHAFSSLRCTKGGYAPQHVPKRIVWAMLKKEKEKKNVHAKRHERKKYMPKSMKKRKRKKEIKIAYTFKYKAFIQKERDS
jgi:K+ transporter